MHTSSPVILTLDISSQTPHMAICQSIYPLIVDGLDIARYPDMIVSILASHGLRLTDIDEYVYCIGPGPFSGLRMASIIARLLYREQICQIRYYHQLEILSHASGADRIAMRAGLRGYYIWNALSSEMPGLVSELTADYDLVTTDRPLISHMLDMMAAGIPGHIVTSIEQIQPLYIREPQITSASRGLR